MPDKGAGVVLRDLIIFQIKLIIDGFKDLVIVHVAIVAALLDVVLPTGRRGHRFYSVVRATERFDRWLNLCGAAEHAEDNEDGLFGESRAGSDSLLGKLEEIVLGRREEEEPGRGRAAA